MRLALVGLLALGTAQAIRVIGIDMLMWGGDYDEYGCKPSTGYTWCNTTQECVSINYLCDF